MCTPAPIRHPAATNLYIFYNHINLINKKYILKIFTNHYTNNYCGLEKTVADNFGFSVVVFFHSVGMERFCFLYGAISGMSKEGRRSAGYLVAISERGAQVAPRIAKHTKV